MSEKRGCLGFLFGMKVSDKHEETLPYKLRDDFLSSAEFSFYKVLLMAIGDNYIICPKVSLADIFFVPNRRENMTYVNKIARKHVDYLLCDKETMRPVMAIELNDQSHNRSSRKARDMFVHEVFKAAKLPLGTVTNSSSYRIEELTKYIYSILKPEQVEAAATMEEIIPICPKCNVAMTIRKSKKTHKEFYGCVNFPQCKETKEIS